MTETQPPNESPGDLLLHLIVALLAPMFLTASGSDINLARLAAMHTVNAYRARPAADEARRPDGVHAAQAVAFLCCLETTYTAY